MVKKKLHYYTKMFQICRKHWSLANEEKKLVKYAARHKIDTLFKWECAHCHRLYAESEIQVDHIIPIGTDTPTNFQDFTQAMVFLHPKSEGLQVLCKRCHNVKSAHENTLPERKLMTEFIVSYSAVIGFPIIGLAAMEYKKLKSLYGIVQKINDEKTKNKNAYRKKLVVFLNTVG
jgi:5-methylcytosine-specific restriction endonuclease McrA